MVLRNSDGLGRSSEIHLNRRSRLYYQLRRIARGRNLQNNFEKGTGCIGGRADAVIDRWNWCLIREH